MAWIYFMTGVGTVDVFERLGAPLPFAALGVGVSLLCVGLIAALRGADHGCAVAGGAARGGGGTGGRLKNPYIKISS